MNFLVKSIQEYIFFVQIFKMSFIFFKMIFYLQKWRFVYLWKWFFYFPKWFFLHFLKRVSRLSETWCLEKIILKHFHTCGMLAGFWDWVIRTMGAYFSTSSFKQSTITTPHSASSFAVKLSSLKKKKTNTCMNFPPCLLEINERKVQCKTSIIRVDKIRF